MKTHTPKASEIEHSWWLVDATDKTLGRLATELARILRGKHKPIYTPADRPILLSRHGQPIGELF